MFRRRLMQKMIMMGGQVPWYKAGGIPTPVGVYKAINAASQAISYINLVNPGTHDLTATVAPTWDATGWIFNGINQFLISDIVATEGWSIAVRFSDSTAAAIAFLAGAENANPWPRIGISVWAGAGLEWSFDYSGGGLAIAEAIPVAGVAILTPQHGYLDAISKGNMGAWGLGACTRALYIGAENVADLGGAGRFFPGKISSRSNLRYRYYCLGCRFDHRDGGIMTDDAHSPEEIAQGTTEFVMYLRNATQPSASIPGAD